MNVVRSIGTPQPVKLTLADFEILHEAGALDRYGKVELIEGALLTMSPQQRAHSFAKNELTYRLRRALEQMGSHLLSQSEPTLAITEFNAPEPDIVLTSAAKGDGYIPLDSVSLVIEIAHTSARFDLGPKALLYAEHGIPEYWVVELRKKRIRQFWSPSETGYSERRSVDIGDPLESATMPELAVDTGGLI